MSQWKTCSGQEKPNGLQELQWGITGKRQHIHQLKPKQPKLGLPLSPCSTGGMPQEGWGAGKGVKSKEKLLWSINTHFPHTTNKL